MKLLPESACRAYLFFYEGVCVLILWFITLSTYTALLGDDTGNFQYLLFEYCNDDGSINSCGTLTNYYIIKTLF